MYIWLRPFVQRREWQMVRNAIDRPQKLCLSSDVIQLLQIIGGPLDERIVLERDRLCMDVKGCLQK
jgi:hypothetical protein